MVDFADVAGELIDLHIQKSLTNRNKNTVPYSGSCLFCQEPVGQVRYCSSECREDHAAELRRKRINGY